MRRIRVTPIRVTMGILGVLLSVIVVTHSSEIVRRLDYWADGRLTVDGMAFHLPSDDQVIAESLLNRGVWEPNETALIRELLNHGDTFIDVGANIGWFTVIASQEVGPQGRVIAFEPDPASCALLRKNVAANGCENVVIEQKALADEPGVLTLHIHSSNKGAHSILPHQLRTTTVDVEALPFDDYDLSGRVDLIKMDVEGAEGIILQGMQQTIENHRRLAFVMEFTPTALRQAGSDPSEILFSFMDGGFAVHIIESPSQDLVPMERREVEPLVESLEQPYKFVNLFIARRDDD